MVSRAAICPLLIKTKTGHPIFRILQTQSQISYFGLFYALIYLRSRHFLDPVYGFLFQIFFIFGNSIVTGNSLQTPEMINFLSQCNA